MMFAPKPVKADNVEPTELEKKIATIVAAQNEIVMNAIAEAVAIITMRLAVHANVHEALRDDLARALPEFSEATAIVPRIALVRTMLERAHQRLDGACGN
jgi:hypothetical protein